MNKTDNKMHAGYYDVEQNIAENIGQYEDTYHCLLKCEGTKTYDEPGNCPFCHMKFVSSGEGQHHNWIERFLIFVNRP